MASERKEKAAGETSHLDGIPHDLPALMRADKLQRRAARVGFDWPDIQGVIEKVGEEIEEVCDELGSDDRKRIREELGDLLFSCVNLARHAGVDAETALRDAAHKFESRFRAMERQSGQAGIALEDLDASALEDLWEWAKQIN